MKTASSVAHAGCGKMAWTETPAEIFRRNCQEKADKIFREKLIADAKKSEEISKKIIADCQRRQKNHDEWLIKKGMEENE